MKNTDNIKQEFLICLTYLLGKIGFHSSVDIKLSTLIFEAKASISANQEVNLRRKYYDQITQHAIHGGNTTIANNILLEISNRQIITIPFEDVCSTQGEDAIDELISNGYECTKVNYVEAKCLYKPKDHLIGLPYLTRSKTYKYLCENLKSQLPYLKTTDIVNLAFFSNMEIDMNDFYTILEDF